MEGKEPMSQNLEVYRARLNEACLYIVVVEALLFGSVWSMFEVSGIPYLFLYWGFVLVGLVKICFQKNTWKEWLVIGVLWILAVLSWRGSEDKTPLLLVLGICCSKELNLDRLIKIDLAARFVASALLIVIPLLGICANHISYQGDRVRMYFGWLAPGGMGLTFLVICVEWMYLRHLNFKWYDYAGIGALWLFEHLTGNARTTDMIMAVLFMVEILAVLLKKWRPEFEQYRLWALGCVGSLAAAVLFPIVGIGYYRHTLLDPAQSPNNLLSRFLMPGWFLSEHGLTLFGSPYDDSVYDYLDMYFGYAALHLGIVIAIVVLVLMIRTIIYGCRTKNEKLLLFFMFVLLRSTMESEHFTLVYAFFPLLLGVSIWERQDEQKQ